MKKWIMIVFGNLVYITGSAQQATTERIEMADAMRASGKIYVVVIVITVILSGLIIYLINTDRKVRRLEKEVSVKIEKSA